MKKTLLALLMVMLTLGAWAQGQRRGYDPEQSATRMATQVKTDCPDLTDEQYKAVYEIFLASSKAMQATRDSIMAAGGGQDGRRSFNREAMQARQEKLSKALQGVLTEAQFKVYTEAQKKRQEERRNRGGFRR